jgi:hypothetical protein
MPSKIVDADNERTVNINERIDKGNALAEMFKAMPWFVWATPGWLIAGLICLAVGHDGIGGFTNHVMGWLALVPWAVGILCGVKAFKWGTGTYNTLRTDTYNRRLLAESVSKARQSVIAAEKKNALLDADIEMAYQMPNIILMLSNQGTAFEYTKGGNLKVLGLPAAGTRVSEMNQQGQIGGAAPLALGAGGALPTQVLYENVRGEVPAGRFLVGVGAAGIDTIEAKRGGACVWIVGLSGTGKSSTAVIRVEERASVGHKFMGVDPHWFKDDSLYHSIYETVDQETGAVSPGAYKDLFVMPMARNTEEAKAVLQAFLAEFYGRRDGRIPKPWQKVTLLVDELGALVDATSDEEEEVKAMLKTITRICGQEARNFEMGGIFISQQATELAWLRKVALMVIVHQLMQDSEKKLATNNDKAVMDDMKTWPIGRTYVFGVGFGQEGPRTVQQPYFAGRRVNAAAGAGAELDHDEIEEDTNTVEAAGSAPAQDERIVPALSGDLRAVYDACQQLIQSGQPLSSRAVAALLPDFGKDKCNNLLNRLADMGYITRRKAV